MKQPKSLQPSIYKACSNLYIWKLSKMGLYKNHKTMSRIFDIFNKTQHHHFTKGFGNLGCLTAT